MYAEVQEPLICLLECEVQLSEVYVGVPVPFVITIFNQTPLPTEFSWGAVSCATCFAFGRHFSFLIMNVFLLCKT